MAGARDEFCLFCVFADAATTMHVNRMPVCYRFPSSRRLPHP